MMCNSGLKVMSRAMFMRSLHGMPLVQDRFLASIVLPRMARRPAQSESITADESR
jgi:hypothetical protein